MIHLYLLRRYESVVIGDLKQQLKKGPFKPGRSGFEDPSISKRKEYRSWSHLISGDLLLMIKKTIYGEGI